MEKKNRMSDLKTVFSFKRDLLIWNFSVYFILGKEKEISSAQSGISPDAMEPRGVAKGEAGGDKSSFSLQNIHEIVCLLCSYGI